YIGKPEFARRTKGEQFFFVNRRFIRSPFLHHAINAAFEGLLQERQYPSYFLFFDIDPKAIDINIHPTKTEIKFDDEHAIYAILRSAVKHSLGQFNVAPSLDFNRDSDLDTPYEYARKRPEAPKIEVDRSFNPFKNDSDSSVKQKFFSRGDQPEWNALYTGLSAKSSGNSNLQIESEAVTGDLFQSEEDHPEAGIFQLQKKYIISSLKEGMLVIHQNRAHYRILYEEFLKNITVKAKLSQQLLFPLVLEMSSDEIHLLREIKDSLEQTGFDFSEIKEGKVEITGIPGVLTESEISGVIEGVLADLEREVPMEQVNNSDLLARTLAKNTAVKTGVSLNPHEQLSI